nr:GDP-mannose 4,6-dehydratase [uncultured Methanolobus sp.]
MSKNAFITGISGQDGSYLAELLLSKGYNVYGLLRKPDSSDTSRIDHIINNIEIIQGDLSNQESIEEAVRISKPDEVYNLAAYHNVSGSWKEPVCAADINGLGVIRVLEAVKNFAPSAHICQASSSEIFGKVRETPQTEHTAFYPRNPYGFSKVLGYWACVNYRENYNMHVSNGILFNHESPRRGIDFVTRKITDSVARIKYGFSNELRLGNLDAKRDWGYAGDYVEAMWRMLQQDKPDDYIIATGRTHSVLDFVELAFSIADLDWEKYVVVDSKYTRSPEEHLLVGDPSKAKSVIGWKPKVKFEELVEMMVNADLEKWKNSTEK